MTTMLSDYNAQLEREAATFAVGDTVHFLRDAPRAQRGIITGTITAIGPHRYNTGHVDQIVDIDQTVTAKGITSTWHHRVLVQNVFRARHIDHIRANDVVVGDTVVYPCQEGATVVHRLRTVKMIVEYPENRVLYFHEGLFGMAARVADMWRVTK